MFWPAVVFVTLRAWLLAGQSVARRACQLVWQPQEVCNQLLQLVYSPLISRVKSLDLKTRKGWKALSLSGELNHRINHCVTMCLLYILVIHIDVEVISRVYGRSTCVWCEGDHDA